MKDCNIKIWRRIILCLGLAALAGCAATVRKEPAGRGMISLKNFCQEHSLRCQWDASACTVSLAQDNIQANILIGSQVALVNGQEFWLNTPSVIKDSEVIVSSELEAKILAYLKKALPQPPKELALKPIKKILIDAGHGGKDPGAIGHSGVQEKGVVLDIAQRLRKVLRKEGIDVVMTREEDKFISLEKRTEIAAKANADLFISVHANASPVKGVNGMEIFCMRDLEYTEKNESQKRINQGIYFDRLAMDRYNPEVENILSDMLYTYKRSEEERFADAVSCQVVPMINVKDRGLKEAGFFVLRNTLVPSILIEVGYLTNPKEERLLSQGTYRQKLAEGLAQGIVKYTRETYAQAQ